MTVKKSAVHTPRPARFLREEGLATLEDVVVAQNDSGEADLGSLTPGPSPVRGRGEKVRAVRGRGEKVRAVRGTREDGGPGKADLHIHTAYSDGMAEVPELLDYVEAETDLDIIAVVDHDDVRGALAARERWARGRYRFELVTGIEVTAQEGHVLALFVEEPVAALRPLARIVEDVRKQGGLCVVPHPMSWLTRSIGAGTLARAGASLDGIEVACRSPAARVSIGRAAALNRRSLGLAELGGSDAHFLRAIGSAYTEFEGRTGADLRRAVLARSTTAAYGPPIAWHRIGAGSMVRQTWRGIRATPRAMGWGPTAMSFVRRVFRAR